MNDTLRDAARRVVISADQGETGLTASDALEALRAALSDPATSTHKQPPLAPTPPDDEPVVGPIQHSNSMCQKDGCTCWCQACERHNWRHEHTLAPTPPDAPDYPDALLQTQMDLTDARIDLMKMTKQRDDLLEAIEVAPTPPDALRDDSMELAHIVHGASDLGWFLSMEVAERLWTAGVRVVEGER